METASVVSKPIVEKQCSVCNETLPVSEFYPDPGCSGGVGWRCKACGKSRTAFLRQSTRDGITWIGTTAYPVVDGYKLCSRCQERKPVSDFSASSTTKTGYRFECRQCRHESRKGNRSSLRYFLKQKITNAKHNLLNGSKAKRSLYDSDSFVTVDDLLDIWNQQQGRCALTGRTMEHRNDIGRNVNNVSIDRIDNSLGYTKGNVRLVCLAANYMRNTMSDCELLQFAESLVGYLRGKHGECCGATKHNGLKSQE